MRDYAREQRGDMDELLIARGGSRHVSRWMVRRHACYLVTILKYKYS